MIPDRSIWAVGDIHGEIHQLERLLAKLEPALAENDRLVFLGDYVDRGPDTRGVIELLLELRENRPDTVFLRGNHEQEMIDSRAMFHTGRVLADFERAANWFSMGGAETIASYPRSEVKRWYERVPNDHWEFIESTAMEFRAEPYLFVHAGIVPPGETWTDEDDPRIWIREPFLSSQADLGAIVVFGHTPFKSGRPMVMKNKIGMDTGAAYGKPLTAVRLAPSLPYDPEKLQFLNSA